MEILKKCIFVDIQHRYSSILIVFRGAGFAHNNWLAHYEIHRILRDKENFDTY